MYSFADMLHEQRLRSLIDIFLQPGVGGWRLSVQGDSIGAVATAWQVLWALWLCHQQSAWRAGPACGEVFVNRIEPGCCVLGQHSAATVLSIAYARRRFAA
jgi:hypothetical protein